jgi:raffinose/stachyose/melibiose transport system permease protein
LLNSYIGLILVYTVFGLPLSIFLLTGYFKSIPNEVLEAAVSDGANIFQIFLRIAVPLARNALLTVALLNFFFIWNDLLLSITFNTDVKLRTIQSGLLSFSGQFGQREWGPTFAATAIAVFPTMIVYLLLNRWVTRGLTGGAVKG